MKKQKKKLRFATKQLINATWVVKYDIPDDDVNRTRTLVGAEPEAVIYEYVRDDKFYNRTKKECNIEEGSDRIAQTLVILYKFHGKMLEEKRHPIRNKKHIFDYSYKGPIDLILDKHEKYLEGIR